jgi:hypothetical protein
MRSPSGYRLLRWYAGRARFAVPSKARGEERRDTTERRQSEGEPIQPTFTAFRIRKRIVHHAHACIVRSLRVRIVPSSPPGFFPNLRALSPPAERLLSSRSVRPSGGRRSPHHTSRPKHGCSNPMDANARWARSCSSNLGIVTHADKRNRRSHGAKTRDARYYDLLWVDPYLRSAASCCRWFLPAEERR